MSDNKITHKGFVTAITTHTPYPPLKNTLNNKKPIENPYCILDIKLKNKVLLNLMAKFS